MAEPRRRRVKVPYLARAIAAEKVDDSQAVDDATSCIRLAAAALCGLVPEEPHFILTGPGFRVRVERLPAINLPDPAQLALFPDLHDYQTASHATH